MQGVSMCVVPNGTKNSEPLSRRHVGLRRACAHTTARRGDNRWVRGRTAVNGLCPGGAPARQLREQALVESHARFVPPARLPRWNRTGSNRIEPAPDLMKPGMGFQGGCFAAPGAKKKQGSRWSIPYQCVCRRQVTISKPFVRLQPGPQKWCEA